ncbi:MAG: ADP-ribosylglycohydrolase family protein [Spirochaetes bacterium]|nr:ADP-ribosylglycohydrolase family protein [Spirochaetota bacterium]
MNRTVQAFVKPAILGLAIGDALGVPVEFSARTALDTNPVTGFRGFGTHNQEPGTWSDDTSLTLCLMDALCTGVDYRCIADKFVAWRDQGLWTAHGVVFDMGVTTNRAIAALKLGEVPENAGPAKENSNGNGSLMRILPLAFYTISEAVEVRRKLAFDVSSMTHGHLRSKIACWFYCEIVRNIIHGHARAEAVNAAREVIEGWQLAANAGDEWQYFHRCSSAITAESRSAIKSTGYVIDSLEAALWCFLKAENFAEAVLLAVNLGNDTDSVGAITGGLAGCFWGEAGLPPAWVNGLAREGEIAALCGKFASAMESRLN